MENVCDCKKMQIKVVVLKLYFVLYNTKLRQDVGWRVPEEKDYQDYGEKKSILCTMLSTSCSLAYCLALVREN